MIIYDFQDSSEILWIIDEEKCLEVRVQIEKATCVLMPHNQKILWFLVSCVGLLGHRVKGRMGQNNISFIFYHFELII